MSLARPPEEAKSLPEGQGRGPAGALPADDALVAFVLAESRALNDGRYDDWLAMFAREGRYWVPLRGAEQSESETYNALADENPLLLKLRVERLKNPRAFSQHPRSRSQHVLQQPQVLSRDEAAGSAVLYTPFQYAESRGDERLLLAGHWVHTLVVEDGALRIALKRVNLLDAGVRLPAIQLFP